MGPVCCCNPILLQLLTDAQPPVWPVRSWLVRQLGCVYSVQSCGECKDSHACTVLAGHLPAAQSITVGQTVAVEPLGLALTAELLSLLLSRAVFDVLYMLIGHGHESEELLLRLDPPDDFFRVRLVRSGLKLVYKAGMAMGVSSVSQGAVTTKAPAAQATKP